jgi:hypothetical protein
LGLLLLLLLLLQPPSLELAFDLFFLPRRLALLPLTLLGLGASLKARTR